MAKVDPEILAHLEWIGFVRPTGLVVSAPALVRAGAILDRRDSDGQRLLRACVEERALDLKEAPVPHLPDFRAFAESVLGWSFSSKGYAGTAENPIPPELEVALADYGETLRPDFAVRELEPQNDGPPWQLLVRVLDPGQDFDHIVHDSGRLEASPHGRMERILRQTRVPAGLLFNGTALRLISAPHGESSGWLDFRVAEMVQTAGRPISTALRLLLSQTRLLSLPRHQRLAALLEDSRKFQNEVSERLAEQVLHALYELLRGFQAAHDASKGELLRQVLAEHPDEVYRALLTVILRLVFLLYAEERDMLPEGETFLRHYSLAGLHERLREDAALFPDTMDQRFGAWAQLLVLFRMIHDGAESGAMRLPKRHGVLFDPDRFKFLEGRTDRGARQIHERIEPPLVPDGTIYRALEKLLVLDGERISYRALDVEQIGSVYETMMGFRLETATGPSLAIGSQKKQGPPTAVDLEALLAEPGTKRSKWIEERAGRKLTDRVKKAVADANTIADLHAALLPVTDTAATPDLVPHGAMVLQPSEERRRSGSHYTPRTLTEPIVRTTLEPVLARVRDAAIRMANGEWRVASGEWRVAYGEWVSEEQKRYVHRALSRPGGLEAGAQAGETSLRADGDVSRGGEVWAGQPDSAGSGIDPSEHRGGMGPPLPGGVHSVHPQGKRQPSGARDTSPAVGRFGVRERDAGAYDPAGAGHPGPAVADSGTAPVQQDGKVGRLQESTPFATHHSPLAVPPDDEVGRLWQSTPFATRHSRFAAALLLDLKVCDPAMGSGAFLVEACRQLGDTLVEAWRSGGEMPAIPPDEDEVIFARRLIAQRCLYGVDRNPVAVDLAKVSLWLVTLAKDHPLTFLDHALRHGDSLVGLSRRQIEAFHWANGELRIASGAATRHSPLATRQQGFEVMRVREHVAKAAELRRRIREAGEDVPEGDLRDLWEDAQRELAAVRLFGDLILAAFFEGEKPKEREAKRTKYTEDVANGHAERHRERLEEWRHAEQPLAPFHWEIEFPEVFEREPGLRRVRREPTVHGWEQDLVNARAVVPRLVAEPARGITW
jgi:hypothetical protein